MLFAPAMGMACLQVLGWLCFFVAALSAAVIVKQFVSPNENFEAGKMLVVGLVFAAGGFGCRWGAGAIRRAAGG